MKRWLAVACVLVASTGMRAGTTVETPMVLREPDRVRFTQPPQPISNFTLTDQHGRALDFSALRGRAALVFFGFTHCRSVCPTTIQSLRKARQSLQDDGAPPAIVLISVDGERDTPAEMNTYLEPFGSGFVGLTGSSVDLRAVADRFSTVFFKGMPSDALGGYDVEHTSQVHLVDPAGYLRATFYNSPPEDIAEVTRYVLQVKRSGRHLGPGR